VDGIDEADDAGRWFEERAARGKISARHRRASIRSLRQGAAICGHQWHPVTPPPWTCVPFQEQSLRLTRGQTRYLSSSFNHGTANQ
jgi:hypothetical protein